MNRLLNRSNYWLSLVGSVQDSGQSWCSKCFEIFTERLNLLKNHCVLSTLVFKRSEFLVSLWILHDGDAWYRLYHRDWAHFGSELHIPPFLHLPCDAVHVLEIVVSYKTVPFGNKEFSYDTIYKDLSYYTVWVPLGFTKKALIHQLSLL